MSLASKEEMDTRRDCKYALRINPAAGELRNGQEERD
jgi:hypothetical protein